MQKIQGIYRHYKGNEYELLGEALHIETEEKMVVYKEVKPPHRLWVRPYDMFFEEVEVDGEVIPRFQKIKDM
jgi:hypothetical protein